MSRETFAAAMRAELDAVVARYEALVRAHEETLARVREGARDGEVAALKADLAQARAEAARLREGEAAAKAEAAALRARVDDLSREAARAREEADRERRAAAEAASKAEAAVADAKKRAGELEAEVRAAAEMTQALESTFAAERRFVEACAGLEGSLLIESIRGAFGADLGASASVYAALKGRGLDALLTQAIKERGRSAVQAPLLSRERTALSGLAAAAGCELITPSAGTRFSASSMDKASSISEPAEEGNVVECLVPGLRLTGTDGALVFPRVVVAAG